MKRHIKEYYNKLKATNIIANFFNLSSIQISNVLLLILIIPVITRIVGVTQFGIFVFAGKVAQFAGSVINYGTGSSGVRDIAFNVNNKENLSKVFYNNLYIRVIFFVLFAALLFFMQWSNIDYYLYIVLAFPVVLAEVFNPLCFFVGVEKLKLFNIYNLLSNIVSIAGILIFIRGPHDAIWLNFILGTANAVTYLGLLIYFITNHRLGFLFPKAGELLKIGKQNFYLTINNISINLQQSIIIFAMPRWGYAALLGPYGICDKIIGQCRILLITISNAVYPHSVHVYKESTTLWNTYRKKTKYLFAGIFFIGSILIFTLADFIIYILFKEHNATATLFLRIMAFVPTISALNTLNVLDQLLKNNNIYIFRIAAVLFFISVIVAFLLLNYTDYRFIGAFTLIVEGCALLMYEYVIKKGPRNA